MLWPLFSVLRRFPEGQEQARKKMSDRFDRDALVPAPAGRFWLGLLRLPRPKHQSDYFEDEAVETGR